MSQEHTNYHPELGFREEAARQALARRDNTFFAAQKRRPLELAWSAAVSLGGLFIFNWSPASIWAFLLIGQWSSVLRNGLKLATAGAEVSAYYAAKAEDAGLWQWVSAMQHNRDPNALKRPPEQNWSPRGLLILDLVMLGIATAMILGIAAERDIPLWSDLAADKTMLWITFLTVFATTVPPLFSDRSPGSDSAPATMIYDAGGAAIIGWVLMTIFAAFADSGDYLSVSVMVVNGLVLLGVPLSIVAVKAYRNSTNWLQTKLDAPTSTAGNRP